MLAGEIQMADIKNETNLRVYNTLKNVNHTAKKIHFLACINTTCARVLFCLYVGTQYVAGQMVFQILAEISWATENLSLVTTRNCWPVLQDHDYKGGLDRVGQKVPSGGMGKVTMFCVIIFNVNKDSLQVIVDGAITRWPNTRLARNWRIPTPFAGNSKSFFKCRGILDSELVMAVFFCSSLFNAEPVAFPRCAK